ncbi:MAG: hypothetical protein GKR98_15655 [Boseongicola sp.]|nr:MAG: hypothetical protein GKR98_15655 [Boseongicola sp.]
MRFFAFSAAIYFLVSTLLTALLWSQPLGGSAEFFVEMMSNVRSMPYDHAAVIIILIWSYWSSSDIFAFLRRILVASLVVLVSALFLSAFSGIKTSFPLIVDAIGLERFFAEEQFAALDRALHFGNDAWYLAHGITDWLGFNDFIKFAEATYGQLWAITAFYLPVIMVLLGEKPERFRRFVILYLISWIFLGNFVALFGYSAGPIYYDRVFGGDGFADLIAALNASGLKESWIFRAQELLWTSYSEERQSIGSGISAFPSVHVAMAAVAALYFSEKSLTLGMFFWILTALILFTSIWTGYHYAVDGYFSILVILGANHYLKSNHFKKHLPINGDG